MWDETGMESPKDNNKFSSLPVSFCLRRPIELGLAIHGKIELFMANIAPFIAPSFYLGHHGADASVGEDLDQEDVGDCAV